MDVLILMIKSCREHRYASQIVMSQLGKTETWAPQIEVKKNGDLPRFFFLERPCFSFLFHGRGAHGPPMFFF